MSDLPSSITSRVQLVEEKIRAVRSRISEIDELVDTDPGKVMHAIVEISLQLQSVRTMVNDIRRLVRYR